VRQLGKLGGRTIAIALVCLAAAAATSTAAPATLRECGRMAMPAGLKIWTYATPDYRCDRARLILHDWLFNGAHAELRGWRCYAGTQAGQIVTCRRGKKKLHARLNGKPGAQIRVD
jgi:hypothetical protein